MKKLIIVRHGQSVHHTKDFTGGWTDLPLTELGRKQAFNTGNRLFQFLNGLTYQFYSSDLIRASETALIIGKFLAKEPILTPELRELNNGIAKNLTLEESKKIELPVTEPPIDWVPYPEAESWRMMDKRIVSFMEKIVDPESDAVLLITHAGPIVAIVDWWLELRDEASKSRIMYDADPCSIAVLGTDTWGSKVIYKLNDTSHLMDMVKAF